jgi:hypothetical protein
LQATGVIVNPPRGLSMACFAVFHKSRETARLLRVSPPSASCRSRQRLGLARPTAHRADVRLGRLLLRWIVRAAGLGFPPAAVGALMLPRMHLQIAPVKEVVAAGDAIALAFGAGSGGSSVGRHGIWRLPESSPRLCLVVTPTRSPFNRALAIEGTRVPLYAARQLVLPSTSRSRRSTCCRECGLSSAPQYLGTSR